MNSVLKSKLRLYNAVCILEKDNIGIANPATTIAFSFPSFPTSFAIGSAKTKIVNQIINEKIKFVQNATFVLSARSFLSLNSCCTIYFWNPASVNISEKLMTIVIVATTPKTSGARTLANIILVIGEISLLTISVMDDHLVDDDIFLFRLFCFILHSLPY